MRPIASCLRGFRRRQGERVWVWGTRRVAATWLLGAWAYWLSSGGWDDFGSVTSVWGVWLGVWLLSLPLRRELEAPPDDPADITRSRRWHLRETGRPL